jgi:hypothetical protein
MAGMTVLLLSDKSTFMTGTEVRCGLRCRRARSDLVRSTSSMVRLAFSELLRAF